MTPAALIMERLTRLRRYMAEQQLDAFLIPRSDAFQGEYVPPADERLAFITGFTGSAGAALVTAETAAFFTDGRYALQARAEVPAEAFSRHDIGTTTPAAWIKANLPRGGVLGIDPWLHNLREAEGLTAAAESAGGILRHADINPVDQVWDENRPPAPQAPAVPHPLAFSGVSSAEERRQPAALLKAQGCRALLLTLPEDVCWLLNVRGADVPYTPFVLSYAILYDDRSVDWFVDPAKTDADLRSWLGDDVRCHALPAFADTLGAFAAEGGGCVWLDPSSCPAKACALLEEQACPIHRAPNPVSLMKACKNPVEIDGARAAHLRDGVAVCRFLAQLAQTETVSAWDEIKAADALYDLRREGAHFRGLSFATISGAGPNGAVIHYHPAPETCLPLSAGPIYLVDSGAQYLDGTTDITRTVALATPDDDMREKYTCVLKGHIAVSRARFPAGTTGDALDKLARAPLQAAGLDYAHGTGHGVGSYLSVHEGPASISTRAATVALQPGMILSNEPGYYEEGRYGIRIENLVIVSETGETDDAGRPLLSFETITLAPYDRNLISLPLLDREDIDWIDDYHRKVNRALAPLLAKIDPAAAAWLDRACLPLVEADDDGP